MREKIYIIEDDINILLGLQAKLSVEGYTTNTHNSLGPIENIINEVMEFKPDLIILDIVLPDKDGFELLQAIKGSDGLRNVPIFSFSNISDNDIKARVDKQGKNNIMHREEENLDEIIKRIKIFFKRKK